MPEYRVHQIEEVLRRLHKTVEGLRGTVVVSIEGFVVAAYSGDGRLRTDNPVDSPQIAAMAASIIALGERVLGRLSRGEIDRILLDGTQGGIVVVPAGREVALAVMVSKDAKLGLVMYEVRRAAEQVLKVLAGGVEESK
ncbi:MAG TPA: roadblock/LC7 domain-containing protein [Anaerolineae bacterium]|nr:roadblock/LC7 domain-containing protein [Anaerolineae bacterium]